MTKCDQVLFIYTVYVFELETVINNTHVYGLYRKTAHNCVAYNHEMIILF